jgi:hypothetical protein
MSRPTDDFDLWGLGKQQTKKTWTIEGKEDIRRAQTKNYASDKVAKQAGFLPASDCFCLIEAAKNGTIDETTHLFLFDNNLDILNAGVTKARSLGFLKITACYGDALDNINHLMNMKVFLPDFVFLDLCGEYNRKVAITTKRLLRRCPVALTLRPYNRKDTESRDNFIIPSGINHMDVAGKILNDPAHKEKYGYEGSLPPETTQFRSQQIVASILAETGRKRCYFATNYPGKQRPMLGLSLS